MMYLLAALATVASASSMKMGMGYYSDNECKHLVQKGDANAAQCADLLDCESMEDTIKGTVSVKDFECEIITCKMNVEAAADGDKDDFNSACKNAQVILNVACEGPGGSGSGEGQVWSKTHVTCSSAAALSMAASAIVTVLALF